MTMTGSGSSGAVIGLIGLIGAARLAGGSVILALTDSSHAADEAGVALDAPQGLHTITGTLSKPIFFRLTRPDQFERLSIGDRITISTRR